MSQLVKFGIVLGIICLIATLVLAVTYEFTKPKIEAQLKQEESSALKAVMPVADSFSEKSVEGIDYFEALKGDALNGYCVRALGTGYNGHIRMIVGIDTKGVISGIEVLEQSETPGLGDRIREVYPGEKEPWFLRQFKGKLAATVMLNKDIDAITGATISSKAVTNAVRDTVKDFLDKVKR